MKEERNWFGLEVADNSDADLAIMGVPYDEAVFFRKGAAEGPAAIRALSSKLPPSGEDGHSLAEQRVADLGDTVFPVHPPDIATLHETAQALWRTARSRGLPLAIGGDHSISIPLFAAAGEWITRSFGVIWIDAHPDLCDTYHDSRYSHACVLRRALESPFLQPEHVVMLGIRSCELEETAFIHENQIPVLTARHLANEKPEHVGEQLVERFAGMPVYLSIDIDALDPAHAPGTGIPDAGGLTTRWLLDLLHALQPIDLMAVDLVEVAPPLDTPSAPTSLLALKIIVQLLSNIARKSG